MIIDEQYTLLRFKTRTTQRWLGSKIEYIFCHSLSNLAEKSVKIWVPGPEVRREKNYLDFHREISDRASTFDRKGELRALEDWSRVA